MQFVASLLQDSDLPDALVAATLDISPPALTFEAELNASDDFLPSSKEFLIRDRAFSWDIRLEEEVHANLIAVDNAKAGKAYIKCEGAPNKKTRKYDVMTIKSEHRQKRQQPIKKEVKVEQPTSNKRTLDGEIKDSESLNKIVIHGTVSSTNLVAAVLTTVDVVAPSPLPVPLVMAAAAVEETPENVNSDILIGAYTKEQRKERIDRFRAKKKRRIWRKQIKYDCRKRLADTRPRVKGRFVSRKDCPDEEGDMDADSSSLVGGECEGDGDGESHEVEGMEIDQLAEYSDELMAQDCEEVSRLLM